jgi:uncharacterized lipoprotein YmbA
MKPSRYCATILFAVLLSLGACGTTPPTKFFLLSPLPATGTPAASSDHQLRLGVGPINLPEYLDRPQIVTRAADNEMRLADDRRWAEPLQDNFAHVLGENLARLLGTGQVHEFPWPPAQAIDYQIVVTVIHFEGDTSGKVSLVARWDVRAGRERTLIVSRRSNISVPVQNPGSYESVVAASSTAVGQLSQEIEGAIKQLPP